MSKNKINIYQNLVLITQIGIVMIVPIILSIYIGKIIDEKLGTSNIFLFIFIIIGVGAAFLNMYKLVMRNINKK